MKGLAIFLTLLLAAGSAFAAELVLQPGPSEGKDAHIRAGTPTYNGGTWSYLTTNWLPNQANRGLCEFTGLTAISKGSTINSAKLELYNRYNNPNDRFSIYRITASWGEMTVTWATQPAYFATAYGTVTCTGSGTYSFDVKKLVDEWVQETYPNYGFIIRKATESGTYPYFCASDVGTTTWFPKLTVDYTPSAVVPTSVGKVKALFK